MSNPRPLAALASRAWVRATSANALRNGAVSDINATVLYGGGRGLKTSTSTSASTARARAFTVLGCRNAKTTTSGLWSSQHKLQQVQVRWKSSNSSGGGNGEKFEGEGEAPTLRRWGYEEINSALPKRDMILIDVREPAELSATGIIPSAVSIPLASQPDALFLSPDEFETRFGFPKPGENNDAESGKSAKSDGDPHVVFYCKAGVRARAAAQLATQAGYDPARIGVYDGSWIDWVDQGGKVEKWEPED